jgi:hypothetical protein
MSKTAKPGRVNRVNRATLMPADLPPLSDQAAVEILDFLHELVFRFEGQYFGQIHRFHQDRRGRAAQPPKAASSQASAKTSSTFNPGEGEPF